MSGRSPIPRTALARLLLAAASAACGGDPVTGPVVPTGVAAADLCAAVAAADCARLDRCGLLDSAFDGSACELWQRDIGCGPFGQALNRAVAAGEGSWLEAAGERCVEAVGAAPCTRGLAASLFELSPCRDAFAPLAQPGDACGFVGSCVEGSFCATEAACPGTCAALSAANERCGVSEPCQAGLYCDISSMRCLSPSDLGAECEVRALGSSCRAGAFCDGSQPGGARCAPARGRGSGCTRPEECAAGLRCIGNNCSGGELGDRCERSSDCQGTHRCARGRCRAPSAEGEACGDDNPCQRGLVCSGEGCAPGLEDGAECPGDVPCAGRCVDGRCAPLAADGAPCQTAADCLEGRACGDGECRAVGPFCPL